MTSIDARPPRKALARTSLKMQAIGFLSRREHSRQELRAKLLATLRRREREDAALAAAAEAHAQAVERALASTPPNGIDDAFAPRAPEAVSLAAQPARAADPDEALDPEARVDQLLDWLEAHGYLSDARFVESRVHARAARQGTASIRNELARHGLALEPEQAAALRESEFARAKTIWQRKFAQVGADARERARQARFLASRGFAAEVVRRIVGGEDDD